MRPEFHFTATRGWINDPHGITVSDGHYEVFYQYVPDSTVWAPNCHWGHARGADMFSLTELPVAIAPGDGDGGIWTGSLIRDESGRTRIFYTATTQPNLGIGRIREATPVDDDWIEWKKGGYVADAPEDLDIIAYRDPFLLKDPDSWRMFVGAGLADGTATALSYRSADLDHWTYEGIALQRSTNETDPVWMGALWECPQIFEVDGRYVMVSSVWDDDVLYYAGYAVGSYNEGRFVAESWGRLTFGSSYYAPSFFRDADGRPCLTFWMRGIQDTEAGWASAHSIPYALHLEENTLIAEPHPDLQRYISAARDDDDLPGLAGHVMWEPQTGDTLTVCSGDTAAITIRADNETLTISTPADHWNMPFTGGEIRVVLDGQTAEISSKNGLLGLSIAPQGKTFRVSGNRTRTQALVR